MRLTQTPRLLAQTSVHPELTHKQEQKNVTVRIAGSKQTDMCYLLYTIRRNTPNVPFQKTLYGITAYLIRSRSLIYFLCLCALSALSLFTANLPQDLLRLAIIILNITLTRGGLFTYAHDTPQINNEDETHSVNISHQYASSWSSIFTSRHHHGNYCEAQPCLLHPMTLCQKLHNFKAYTSTHQTCTRSDASESDAMIQ